MEEPLDFEQWVRARIDERQIRARREKAEAIRGAILRGDPLPGVEDDDTPVAPSAAPSGSGRRGLWLGLAAILLLGLGSALGFGLSRTGDDAHEQTTLPEVSEPPAPQIVEAVDDATEEAATAEAHEAASPAGEAQEAPPAATSEAAPASEMRRRRRARRTMRPAMTTATPEDGDSLEPWGWE